MCPGLDGVVAVGLVAWCCGLGWAAGFEGLALGGAGSTIAVSMRSSSERPRADLIHARGRSR